MKGKYERGNGGRGNRGRGYRGRGSRGMGRENRGRENIIKIERAIMIESWEHEIKALLKHVM